MKNRILDVVEDLAPKVDWSATVNSALNLTIAHRAAHGDVLRLTGEPPPVVNCRNGSLWIGASGDVELRPHSPLDYLTSALTVGYDPDARCPLFDRTVREIFRDATRTSPRDRLVRLPATGDMVRHIEELMGYAIQPRRDVTSWWLLQGSGSNGKTRLMETVAALMGPSSVKKARIDKIEDDQFALGSLVGKLMLLDDDVKDRTVFPDGFLKILSERKTLSAQHKFKDHFEFVSCALPVMLCNNWPKSHDLSGGTRRRAHIVPFDRSFVLGDDLDPTIFDRIWATELPGVLNRALRVLRRLRRRGWFKDPVPCQMAKRRWLEAANPLTAFLQQECEHEAAARTPLTEFYAAYRAWASESNVRVIEPRNTIKDRLESLDYHIGKMHGNVNAVCGVKCLRSAPEEAF